MKHLKRLNESIDHDELIDFCEQNLTSLFDYGYKLVLNEIWRLNGPSGYEIIIFNFYIGLDWDKFKLDYIPFLELLLLRYKPFESIRYNHFMVKVNNQDIKADDIVSDNFTPNSSKVRRISLSISNTI